MTHRLWAIVPAAGRGSRFSSTQLKQYLTINDRYVIQHSVERLTELPLQSCMIAVSATDDLARHITFNSAYPVEFCLGGAERSDSVFAALQALKTQADLMDWVLVHDAARPCVHRDSLNLLWSQLQQDDVGGILAIPVRDTLKKVADAGIVETVSREQLWHAQTPQLFRFGVLYDALSHALAQGIAITDEASAVEAFGLSVKVVPSRQDNIKLTYPEDLELARLIINSQ